MYQTSIIFVWFSHRKHRRQQKQVAQLAIPAKSIGKLAVRRAVLDPKVTIPAVVTMDRNHQGSVSRQINTTAPQTNVIKPGIDGFISKPRPMSAKPQVAQRPVAVRPPRPSTVYTRPEMVRGVDGFMVARKQI